METVIWMGLAFWAGWKLRGITMAISIVANPEPLLAALRQAELLKASESKPRLLRIEHMNDHIYLYAQDTGEFLAQGITLEEAMGKLCPNDGFKAPAESLSICLDKNRQ